MKKNSVCPKSLGLFFAVIAILVWGITFVSTEYLLGSFSPLEILFVRFLLAYLGLLLFKPVSLCLQNKKDNVWFLLAGLSGIIIYQFTENAALSFTTASNVSIIVSICPMFTAIISQIFLRETCDSFLCCWICHCNFWSNPGQFKWKQWNSLESQR